MKKDYSKVFGHYYGLQYDGNVDDMIKIHQLMEDAEIVPAGSTENKLGAYYGKRPFKVNYFISKVGKTLKWCPTNSAEKFGKMTLMSAEWWIEQLSDDVKAEPVESVELPKDWLTVQLTEHIKSMMEDNFHVTTGPKIVHAEDDLVEEYEVVEEEDDALPF